MRILFAAAALSAAAPALAQDAGETQFASTCAACHQSNGQGIKGAFPALAGDPFVVGAPAPVITTVLNGRGGMPSWKADLTDDQIAAALTYVRSAWGNSAPPVTAAMVAVERAKSAAPPPAPLQSH
jgi:mono/diheme cytochrome c family protein